MLAPSVGSQVQRVPVVRHDACRYCCSRRLADRQCLRMRGHDLSPARWETDAQDRRPRSRADCYLAVVLLHEDPPGYVQALADPDRLRRLDLAAEF